MNLEEATRRNKFTMSATATRVAWTLGTYWQKDDAKPMVTPNRVISVIAKLIRVRPIDLATPCSKYKIAHPRQIAMMIVRDECPTLSLPQIARFFGGVDHTTVSYGIGQARKKVVRMDHWRELYLAACQQLEIRIRL